MKQILMKASALIAGLLLVAQVQAAAPLTFSFYGITGNDTSGNAVADGVANLKMQVIDFGNQKVRFEFTNKSDYSSLTRVYFDDGALLGISGISFSSGVSFSQGAKPGNLPGANGVSPAFKTTAGFLADSDPPVNPNGVQKNEWLAIDFQLLPTKSFADVAAALALPSGGDWLRVGLHVQSFAGGHSESFINNPVVAIPEADSYALLLAGFGLIGFLARRRIRD
jgi:hypothetical protein